MGKSILKKRREGQPVESLEKLSVVLKGNKGSPIINELLPELHRFRGGNSTLLAKKHQDAYPFEYPEDFARFLQGKLAGLFVLGSHSKKRPNNLVMGRTFNHEILDMFEFEVKEFRTVNAASAAVHVDLRPLFVFQGDLFEVDPVFNKAKSLFLDYFGGHPLQEVDAKSLTSSIVVTVTEAKDIHLNYYAIRGSDLLEIGPQLVLALRRHKLGDDSQYKAAYHKPKTHKKVKNMSTNSMKQKKGQLHVQQQDIKTIALKKRKKLKTRQSK